MKMNGNISDEADGINLSTELYSHYVQLTAEPGPEYEAKRLRIRNGIVGEWHQKATRMLKKDVQYTSYDLR